MQASDRLLESNLESPEETRRRWCRKKQESNCFTVRAAKDWNNLPEEFSSRPGLNILKRRLERHSVDLHTIIWYVDWHDGAGPRGNVCWPENLTWSCWISCDVLFYQMQTISTKKTALVYHDERVFSTLNMVPPAHGAFNDCLETAAQNLNPDSNNQNSC